MGKDTTFDFQQKNEKERGVGEAALAYATDATPKTLDDYLRLPEGARVELIKGVFYDMAAPNVIHQVIAHQIGQKLGSYVDQNGGDCVVLNAPTDVQLFADEKTVVQPDVFVVCDRKRITRERLVGQPDLAIEIVSESNWMTDVHIKKKLYFEAGVREYWILFPKEKKIQVYDFERGAEVVPKEYTFEDKVPVGIWNGKCCIDFHQIYEKYCFLEK